MPAPGRSRAGRTHRSHPQALQARAVVAGCHDGARRRGGRRVVHARRDRAARAGAREDRPADRGAVPHRQRVGVRLPVAHEPVRARGGRRDFLVGRRTAGGFAGRGRSGSGARGRRARGGVGRARDLPVRPPARGAAAVAVPARPPGGEETPLARNAGRAGGRPGEGGAAAAGRGGPARRPAARTRHERPRRGGADQAGRAASGPGRRRTGSAPGRRGGGGLGRRAAPAGDAGRRRRRARRGGAVDHRARPTAARGGRARRGAVRGRRARDAEPPDRDRADRRLAAEPARAPGVPVGGPGRALDGRAARSGAADQPGRAQRAAAAGRA